MPDPIHHETGHFLARWFTRPTPAPLPSAPAVVAPPAFVPAPSEPANVVPLLETPSCKPIALRDRGIIEKVPGFYPKDTLKPGQIVLTFDDGPHAHTEELLDILKKHDAKATFFVCGNAITGANYTVLARMIKEGHLLGNHTYTHVIGLPRYTQEGIEKEYRLNQAVVDIALTATSPADFEAKKKALLRGGPMPDVHPYTLVLSRPTGGDPYIHDRWGRRVRDKFDRALNDLGLYNIIWNAQSDDSDGHLSRADRNNPWKMAASIDRWTKPGGLADRRGIVLLMHDRIPPKAVDMALERIAAHPGQQVVPLDQVMAEKYQCGADDS